MLSCRLKKPRGPFDDDCGIDIESLGGWPIAETHVQNEYRCRLDAFKPFHRIAAGEVIVIAPTDIFGEVPLESPSITRAYRISQGFVSNFRAQDMTIAGPSWLSLQDGWLVGGPPPQTTEQKYIFQVSARNKMGTDTVELTIVVR